MNNCIRPQSSKEYLNKFRLDELSSLAVEMYGM